jgi:hypothetical protein
VRDFLIDFVIGSDRDSVLDFARDSVIDCDIDSPRDSARDSVRDSETDSEIDSSRDSERDFVIGSLRNPNSDFPRKFLRDSAVDFETRAMVRRGDLPLDLSQAHGYCRCSAGNRWEDWRISTVACHVCRGRGEKEAGRPCGLPAEVGQSRSTSA